jgi:hypothetical protein
VSSRDGLTLAGLALVGADAVAYNVDFEVGPVWPSRPNWPSPGALPASPTTRAPVRRRGVMLGNVLELAEGRIRLERVLGRFGAATYSLGSVRETLAELRHCAGTHFDPTVVEALARVV